MTVKLSPRWPHAMQLWRGQDLLIETCHGSIGSVRAEVLASKARIDRGEADRLVVFGVPAETWRAW